jgi:hypothetical protein
MISSFDGTLVGDGRESYLVVGAEHVVPPPERGRVAVDKSLDNARARGLTAVPTGLNSIPIFSDPPCGESRGDQHRSRTG